MTDGKKIAEEIAKQLVGVQPMPNDVISKLHEVSKDKKWLEENGYKPIDRLGLFWIKECRE